MAGNKNMVYFILYIVLITELLIVITERDELMEVEKVIRDKMVTTLALNYQQDVILSIPTKTSDYNIRPDNFHSVVMIPLGVTSDKEKDNSEYFIDIDETSKTKPSDWPNGGISLENSTDNYKLVKEGGNAIFTAKFTQPGTYVFTAFCKVERILPDYLPKNLLEYLEKQVGEEHLHKKSIPELFEVTAKRQGGLKTKAAEFLF
ncbi:MAG: hypothetical protein KJ799_16830 [Bacteroidetes bacterium]|nr:hypothetical protein [Bacteroidota bacterium]MBU1678249.1 hypothetical protein [Bacteroidota bacterium]MBU2508364.1 hypothetical protein [Bacteroidota bacterium]